MSEKVYKVERKKLENMKFERFEDIINTQEFNEAFKFSEEISKILSGRIKTL